MVKFMESREKDVAFGAIGAGAAVVAIPHTPQFMGKFTNLAVGAIMIAASVFIEHKSGIGYFFLGAGVIYLVDGLVRLTMPNVATSTNFAVQNLVFPQESKYQYIA